MNRFYILVSGLIVSSLFWKSKGIKKDNNNMRHLNHFDLPKEKNLEIIIFQESEPFIQHR